MSTKIQNLAWEVPNLSLAQRVVLVSLADQGNDYGECYPGLESLRRRCSLSLRGVYKAIAELEALDLLSREQLPGSNTLYRLHIDRLLQIELLPSPGARRPALSPYRSVPAKQSQNSGMHVVQGAQGAGCTSCEEGGAPGAPIEATSKSKATYTDNAGARDFTGTLEGHTDPPPAPAPAGTPAGAASAELRKLGYRITSQDPNLIAAMGEGVVLPSLLELAEIYPADSPKCNGSAAYVIATARRQNQRPPDPLVQDARDGPRAPRSPDSAAARVRRLAVEGEERDRRAAAHHDAHVVDAHD